MPNAQLFDKKGKSKGQVDLAENIFGLEPNDHLLYLATVRQEANARGGNAHTKTRTEVRGGGAKPWRQKGTGRARAGSIRSPLWVGGGIMHGPRNNVNWTKGMNKKERKLALCSALSDALKSEKLFVVEEIGVSQGKTSEFASLIKDLKCAEDTTLFVVDAANESLDLIDRSSRNIPSVKVVTEHELSVKDLLKAKKIFFTQSSVKAVENRFNGAVKEAA